MSAQLRVLAVCGAVAVTGCMAVLGLGDYRDCDGGECDAAVLAPDAAEASPPLDAGDGSADAYVRACGENLVWSAPNVVPLEVLGDGGALVENAQSFRLSADELTVYFHNQFDDGGFVPFELFAATRKSLAETQFVNAAPLTSVNTSADELSPWISQDGKTLYYASNRAPCPVGNIYASTRPTTADYAFVNPKPVRPCTTNQQALPSLSYDEGELWLAWQAGTYDWNIYRASRIDGGFGSVSPVTELNSTASDTYPMLVDPLTVYFSSERPSTHGQANIFRATRVSPDAGWGEAAAVDELNSDIWDAPTWMSLDGCRLYITSGRADPGHQLYVASRGN